jgi:hypothetical protein
MRFWKSPFVLDVKDGKKLCFCFYKTPDIKEISIKKVPHVKKFRNNKIKQTIMNGITKLFYFLRPNNSNKQVILR